MYGDALSLSEPTQSSQSEALGEKELDERTEGAPDRELGDVSSSPKSNSSVGLTKMAEPGQSNRTQKDCVVAMLQVLLRTHASQADIELEEDQMALREEREIDRKPRSVDGTKLRDPRITLW